MKFLFLDIDGVLCTMRSHVAADPDYGGLMVALDPVAVQMVNRICEATACKIVISSSWRDAYGYNETCTHLRAAGLHRKYLYMGDRKAGATPNKVGLTSRGREIKAYLDGLGSATHHGYVIIDDDSDMLAEQMPSFVKTDGTNGLMYENMVRAVEILNACTGRT